LPWGSKKKHPTEQPESCLEGGGISSRKQGAERKAQEHSYIFFGKKAEVMFISNTEEERGWAGSQGKVLVEGEKKRASPSGDTSRNKRPTIEGETFSSSEEKRDKLGRKIWEAPRPGRRKTEALPSAERGTFLTHSFMKKEKGEPFLRKVMKKGSLFGNNLRPIRKHSSSWERVDIKEHRYQRKLRRRNDNLLQHSLFLL